MNTDNNVETSDAQDNTQPGDLPAPVPAKARSGLLWLTLLLSLLSIGLAAVTYRLVSVQQSDTTLSDEILQGNARITRLQQMQESLAGQLASVQASIANLEQTQRSSAETLRNLAGNMVNQNVDLMAGEVEQLLLIAMHKLTLEQDVETALAALNAADRRLAGIDNPELLNSRSQLAADMNALKSVTHVDVPGLSLKLTDMINHVDDLPLKQMPAAESKPLTRPEDTAMPAWRRLLLAVWDEFRGTIVITRTSGNAKATLLPAETWFLHQNLRLQLETARLAVIRRDTQTLHTAMQTVSMWLTDYYDTADNRVTNILQTVQEMADLELAPGLPDISSSLETLRVFIKSRSAAQITGPGSIDL